MKPEDLLERIAGSLRHDVGPAVEDPFARTQAFMMSVILEKLSRQMRVADAHARADRADLAELVRDLEAHPSLPARVVQDSTDLSQIVAALYAARDGLDADTFDALLGRVRRTLRARLDRQLEYAS